MELMAIFTLRLLIPGEGTADTHWKLRRHRAVLDAVEKRAISCPPRESKTRPQPVAITAPSWSGKENYLFPVDGDGRRYRSTRLHGVAFQKTVTFVLKSDNSVPFWSRSPVSERAADADRTHLGLKRTPRNRNWGRWWCRMREQRQASTKVFFDASKNESSEAKQKLGQPLASERQPGFNVFDPNCPSVVLSDHRRGLHIFGGPLASHFFTGQHLHLGQADFFFRPYRISVIPCFLCFIHYILLALSVLCFFLFSHLFPSFSFSCLRTNLFT
jgi:hypothetical protein